MKKYILSLFVVVCLVTQSLAIAPIAKATDYAFNGVVADKVAESLTITMHPDAPSTIGFCFEYPANESNISSYIIVYKKGSAVKTIGGGAMSIAEGENVSKLTIQPNDPNYSKNSSQYCGGILNAEANSDYYIFVATIFKDSDYVNFYSPSLKQKSVKTSANVASCINSVINSNGDFSIELLGSDGKRSANCRFVEYKYDILSGNAFLKSMNEYVLVFDSTKAGRIRLTTNTPTYYQAEFEIGFVVINPTIEDIGIPPAGYEDEVLTSFSVNPFKDTNLNSTEGKAAAELYRRAVVGGFTDGEFKGNRPVNRAETAKFLLLARYKSVDNVSNNGRFSDILNDQWYTKFVMAASELGIVSGYPDGTFQPARTVSTVEFLKMLTKTFNLEANLPNPYVDVASSDWYAPFVGVAKKYNLFPNRVPYLLQPDQALTRNEVAVAIYQYLSQK